MGSFFLGGESGGRLQLSSVKRRSIKLVRPLLQYNIDLLCREYNYLRKCIDLLLEEKEREMVKKNKRIQMPTCNRNILAMIVITHCVVGNDVLSDITFESKTATEV